MASPDDVAPTARRIGFRRPRLVWVPLGFIIAPVLGALPVSIVMTAGREPLITSLPGIWNFTAMFGAYGVAAAFLVGGPWAILTRNRSRPGRVRVVLETMAIGAVFVIGFALFAGGHELFTHVDDDGVAAAAERGAGIARTVAVFGAMFWIAVSPVAGVVMAWLAFARAGS